MPCSQVISTSLPLARFNRGGSQVYVAAKYWRSSYLYIPILVYIYTDMFIHVYRYVYIIFLSILRETQLIGCISIINTIREQLLHVDLYLINMSICMHLNLNSPLTNQVPSPY